MGSKTAVDEQAAISATLAGNQDAYRVLVDRYQAGLVFYIYGIVGDEATANDIAQEAFIAAYQKLRQYNPNYAFSTWLYRIARNLAYRGLKQRNRWTEYDDQAHADDDATLDERIEHAMMADDLRRALGSLRPEWRSAVQMYYWEGKSYKEIAALLDTPVSTVRVWMLRAKEALRSSLL